MSLNTMGSASTKPPAVMGRFLASCSAAKAPAVASPPCRLAGARGLLLRNAMASGRNGDEDKNGDQAAQVQQS